MAIIKEKLIECVPNFSEGQDPLKIEQIKEAVASVNHVRILHTDSGFDVNRTVITFIGTDQSIAEAAFRAIKKAAELIDMEKQQGKHPRIGATDVCPIVPVRNITMRECVVISRQLARRVASQLQIPVYLYEESARSPERKNLADIRRGGYKGLNKKMQSIEWKPDFGPQLLVNNAGATVIGARNFLIAFNINIDSTEIKKTRFIAEQIRERGGKSTGYKPGLFSHCKAISWFIEEYKCCQVSVNLTDYRITSVHHVYEKVKEIASGMGLKVRGSELIGLIPYEAIFLAGEFYNYKQRLNLKEPREKIQLAIDSMAMNSLKKFAVSQRILNIKECTI